VFNIVKSFLQHVGVQRYLKNTSWLLAGQMVRMLLGLLVSLAIARHLGPDDFGLFNYVLSVVALVAVGARLGMDDIVRREFVVHAAHSSVLFGTAARLSAWSSLAIFSIFLIVSFASVRGSSDFWLFCILGASILFHPLRFVDIWFQAQTRGDLSFKSSIPVTILFAGVKCLALLAAAPLIAFCWIYLIELAAVALVQAAVYQKYFCGLQHWRFRADQAKVLLSESWPLILSSLAISIYMHVDLVMLGLFLDKSAVGHYAAATKISTLAHFLPVLLAASLFPAIVRAKERGALEYFQRLQQYFDLNCGLAYCFILPVSLLAPWWVGLLFGADYAESGRILMIHAWSALFVFIGVARNQYLLAEHYIRFSLYATGLGALLNVLLNYYLIPAYGGIGAAIATLLSYGLSAYGSSLLVSRVRSIFWLQTRALCLPLQPVRFFRSLTLRPPQ
jgi:O-antigen/teichoic acid export membrane protein